MESNDFAKRFGISEMVMKVVEITDVFGGDKSSEQPHTNVYNKNVYVYSVYEGSSAMIKRLDTNDAIYTSRIEDVYVTNNIGEDIVVVIETQNTVYTLKQALPNN